MTEAGQESEEGCGGQGWFTVSVVRSDKEGYKWEVTSGPHEATSFRGETAVICFADVMQTCPS